MKGDTSQLDCSYIERRFDEIMLEIDKINSALPKDVYGNICHEEHKKYHESMILAAEAQQKFWREIRLDVMRKGIWTLTVVLLGLIAVGIKLKLGILFKAL